MMITETYIAAPSKLTFPAQPDDIFTFFDFKSTTAVRHSWSVYVEFRCFDRGRWDKSRDGQRQTATMCSQLKRGVWRDPRWTACLLLALPFEAIHPFLCQKLFQVSHCLHFWCFLPIQSVSHCNFCPCVGIENWSRSGITRHRITYTHCKLAAKMDALRIEIGDHSSGISQDQRFSDFQSTQSSQNLYLQTYSLSVGQLRIERCHSYLGENKI